MPEYKKPSIDQLKKALEIAEKIKTLETQLASLLGSGTTTAAAVKAVSALQDSAEPVVKKGRGKGKVRAKRELSPEAREKIAAAQRARWAKAKKASK